MTVTSKELTMTSKEQAPLEFAPHTIKQDTAIFSDKPIVVLACGIQFGKTMTGAIKTKLAMIRFHDPKDSFIVTAPTYKIMQQSTLPAFLDQVRGLGDFHKGDMVFKMYHGGNCYFRTATDPDSIVGVTNVRFIWGDECGLYPLYFWENMQARAAFKKAQICLTTSPYSLNWLYKEIIRPIMKEGPSARPNVELVRARSDENPFFPKDYYQEKKRTMDPRRFQMMFGGEWTKFAGLVYDCFDDEENTCEPIPLPDGSRMVAGIDWGHTNPFSLTIRAVTPDGVHYQVGEVYETGLTISDMVERAQQKKAVWGIERFYCDPSEPGYIEEFNRNGLTAVAANNDIRVGIDHHYELIKSRKFKLFRGRNKYSLDEYETYRYPDDEDNRGPNQDYRERKPVARNDHAMDSARYCTIHTYRYSLASPVIIEESNKTQKRETYEQRLKRLKSLPMHHLTENWD